VLASGPFAHTRKRWLAARNEIRLLGSSNSSRSIPAAAHTSAGSAPRVRRTCGIAPMAPTCSVASEVLPLDFGDCMPRKVDFVDLTQAPGVVLSGNVQSLSAKG